MRACEGPLLRSWVESGLRPRTPSPTWSSCWSDPDEGVRRAAASALGGIGPAAKDAAPDLVKLLNDPDEGVRRGRRFWPWVNRAGGQGRRPRPGQAAQRPRQGRATGRC